MQELITIFYIVVLIISLVLHELAHGYAALSQGDKTALYAGRLTANPLKHLDLWGSFLIPLFLIITSAGFIIGWAKPVPYNPNNLRNRRWGTLWVASAGVLTNLLLATVFGLLLRFLPFGAVTQTLLEIIVITNIVLAVFNLVPIPPLDGSKILFTLLPARFESLLFTLERYSFLFVIIFVIYGWRFVVPLVSGLFTLITGTSW